jgi:CRP-like cAMP-binding protein
MIRRVHEESYFGERAIIMNEPRSATVAAEGEVVLLKLSQEDFLSVIDEAMQRILIHRIHMQDDSVVVNDLQVCRRIGSGSFGAVFLTKHKEKEVYYALKSVPRLKIDYSKMYNHILREKHILM